MDIERSFSLIFSILAMEIVIYSNYAFEFTARNISQYKVPLDRIQSFVKTLDPITKLMFHLYIPNYEKDLVEYFSEIKNIEYKVSTPFATFLLIFWSIVLIAMFASYVEKRDLFGVIFYSLLSLLLCLSMVYAFNLSKEVIKNDEKKD